MGNLFGSKKRADQPPIQASKPSKVNQSDVVKSNLKKSRDYIQNFIDRKQKQRDELNQLILKKYETDKNKKSLLPLLQTKKESQTRLILINKTIRDIEMQQTNLQTIKVLEESNKFKQKIQDELQQMDWRGILEEAKQKYQGPQWEEKNQQEDQDFQKLWKQLGGDKMQQLNIPPCVQTIVPKVIEIQQIIDKKEVQYV